jgi:glycosyltransferase involved in cell wall biosynthesis
MRIAQIAPLYEDVPPRLYGGTERVVSHLTEALVALGHDVTLFASAGSRTAGRLVACRDQALRLDPELSCDLPAHMVMFDEVLRRADDFDILHFHTDCLHMPLFRTMADRTLTTLHGRLDLKDLTPLYSRYCDIPVVAISDDQRRTLPAANFVGTVHHGLLADRFPFTAAPGGDYVAFLGRISPEKRPDRAIAIAKAAGVPLKIAAKVDRADEAYFREQIAPLLDHPLIEFIGEIDDREKGAFLGNARALLFPIDWPEPFGLVMIEAMACGTPVIAWPCGSVPEVLEDGVTGLLADSIESAAASVSVAAGLDRRRIRAEFETRFSAETMARAYLHLYERRLAARPKRTRLQPVSEAANDAHTMAAQAMPRPAERVLDPAREAITT